VEGASIVSHRFGTTPPRFVFMLTAVARGGTLSVLAHFWRHLPSLGRVVVIANGPDLIGIDLPVTNIRGALSSPFRFPGIWVYFFRMLVAGIRASRGAKRAILLPQDSVATGAAAALAARLTGARCVVMEHGTAVVIYTPFLWRERIPARTFTERSVRPLLRGSALALHQLCIRLADGVLVPSRESHDIYRAAGFPPERIHSYHVPVDLERFRPATDDERLATRARFGIPSGATLVGSVARLAPEKALELIFDAVASLPTGERPWVLIGGDGPQRKELERHAAGVGVPVIFTGPLADVELPRVLGALDVFAYTSRQGTNVPNATLEAMASGLAVVATDQPPAHHEMFAEGRGVVIPTDNAAALVSALRGYVTDRAARERAGRAARLYVEAHHSDTAFGADLDRFLKSMGVRSATVATRQSPA
jgi:glycosyltransferase involved in cell wall biosynthesis